MKKNSVIVLMITAVLSMIYSGCGSRDISEELVGRYTGTYTNITTEYGREAFKDYEVLSDYYYGDDQYVYLEIESDGEWLATIDGDKSRGKWTVTDDDGKKLSLRIIDPDDSPSSKGHDSGWTFKKSGEKYIFGFNEWKHFDIEMEKQ